MQKAVACGKHNVVAWLLFNCDHDMFDMENLMNKACSFGWLDIVKWLFEKMNHDSLDLKEILNQACRYGLFDIVTLVLENTDHKKVRYIVKYVLENNDHKSLYIMEAVSIIYSSIMDDDDGISDQRKKYEPLIKLMLCEKNDPKHLGIKEAMNTACSRSHFDLVEWMLANIENILFDFANCTRDKGTGEREIIENDKSEEQEMEEQEGEKEDNEGGDKEDEDKERENINGKKKQIHTFGQADSQASKS
ncbi:unnamed protein product [Mytilus edulis]|uniref:Ankyrin repeat protein n=1 Tax=Mytilus edulis TaxID=6550 RepID=A0A8S3UU47_MYTED|nr:unnamed protein product [Mytilus edulis]